METSRSKIQDFFLYLFDIVCLYVSAVSFLALLYAIINNYFSDSLFDYSSFDTTGTKMAIASLIIFYPLYIWLTTIIGRATLKFPENASLLIRKILYYFTLFIAGLTIAIDLVVLIFNFLDGEISPRFILKVLAVLIVGGTIFGYYLYSLKKDVSVRDGVSKITAIVVSVLVVIALITGLILSGSPMKAREMKMDNQRISDLTTVQYAILDYYRNNNVLPADLITLSQSGGYYLTNLNDPETKTKYEYKILEKNKYELCAEFSLPSAKNNYGYTTAVEKENWEHSAGRTCFQRITSPGVTPAVPGK